MKQNKRFVLLVAIVLLANCLFAGLASAAVSTDKYGSLVTGYKRDAAIEFFYDKGSVNEYGDMYAPNPIISLHVQKDGGNGYGPWGSDAWIDVGFTSKETENTFQVTSDNPEVVSVSSYNGGIFQTYDDGYYAFDVQLVVHKLGKATIKIAAIDNIYRFNGASTTITLTISKDAAGVVTLVAKPIAKNYKVGDVITAGLAKTTVSASILRYDVSLFKHDIEAFVTFKNLAAYSGYGDVVEVVVPATYYKDEATGEVKVATWRTIYAREYEYSGLYTRRFEALKWSVDKSSTGAAELSAVAADGSLTIKFTKAGKVTIKAEQEGDARIYDTVTFTVDADPNADPEGKVTIVTEDGKKSATVRLIKGEKAKTLQLKAKDGAEIVKWESSNTKVATIDEKGVLTPKKEGTTQITATTKDGAKGTFNFKVKKVPVSSLKVDKKKVTLKAGEEVTLKATVKPEYAYTKEIKWVSSDKKVAKVSDGVITGVKAGECEVIATAKFAKDTVKAVVIKVTVK